MTILEEKFLNKRVSILVPDRDHKGKIINRWNTVIGICTFIGPNPILEIPLQVTIDRTPFELKHINHIKLV